MIKKLLELGFEKKRLPGLKCNTLVYDLERGADRFPSYLVYFKENQDFGLFTRKSGIRELKESNLMKNIGKCSTNKSTHFREYDIFESNKKVGVLRLRRKGIGKDMKPKIEFKGDINNE